MAIVTDMTPVSPEDAGVVVSARLPRTARVRAKADFGRVFESGRRTADPLLAVHWLDDGAPARLGLAVSRKVDPRAVGRNRLKRILRDAFRRERRRLRTGAFVVVVRPAAAAAGGEAVRDAFARVLLRAGALPPPPAVGTMPPASLSP